MAIFAVKRGSSANLASLPVQDGSFIVTSDNQRLYVDLGTKRHELGDILTVASLPSTGMNASKFYFLTTDNCLYKYIGGEWKNLSQSGIEITTGTTNGTINVLGQEVAVAGLGSAAFKNMDEVATHYFQVGSEVELLALSDMKQGDIAVVKELIAGTDKYEYTGYVYDSNTWKAMDGNYSAENVYFKDDIIMAGNYTSVGNASKGNNTATGSIASAGKSLKDVMQAIFTKELQPAITANPAVTVTLNKAGEYEVGTTVSGITYTASLSAGSYTYGPATGITATAWNVTNTAGESFTTASGSCSDVVVADATNYKVTAVATHGAGAAAKTNLGNATSTKIAAGTKTGNSKTITGFRKMFHGSKTSPMTLNSANIRTLTGAKVANGVVNVTVVDGAKQVIFAVPASKKITKVEDTGAFGTDIVASFVKQSPISVNGASNGTGTNYNVYVYSPAAALGANTYKVTVANA